jgi:hypothetical protein
VLNVKPKEKLCVALVGVGLAGLAVAAATWSGVLLAAALGCLGAVVALNIELYRYLSRGRGAGFALAVVPLHLTYYAVSGLSFLVGHIAHRLARSSTALPPALDDA